MTVESEHVAFAAQPPHALIVDDNECNRRILSLVVASAGATSEQASDGEAALQKLTERAFDIVFMDIAMPRMDGLAATAAIREAGYEVVVVAVTANFDACDTTMLVALGFDGLIPKPIDMGRVLGWMQLLESGRAQKREGP